MKKVILTQSVIENDGYCEIRDALSHDWTIFLHKLRLIPFPIPNKLQVVEPFINTVKPDLIIITGGNNVPKKLYQKGISEELELTYSRDILELFLIKYALLNNIPLLGVCRGMQMIQVFFGGQIDELDNSTLNHVNNCHLLSIIESNFTKDLNLIGCEVNSYHNFGIYLKNLSKGLNPFAVTSDNVVEGFYHCEKKVIGISWHPERYNPGETLDQKLFNYLLK